MTKQVYKIIFHSQAKVYELYAKKISQSNMLGFIEIEDLLFGEKSAVVVDPTEEKIKAEFEGVTRAYIPLHSVIRIDEVEKQGINKILPAGESSNVAHFPSPIYSTKKGSDD